MTTASSATRPPGDRATIVLPDPSLVLLVGAAGAGKSTFAARRFAPDEIRSSDALRAALTGDVADQSRNRLVFALLHRDVERRLGAGLLTVVDATNVEWHARRPLLAIARRARRPCVAIVLDLPLEEVLVRNRARPGAVPASAVERQHRRLAAALERDALTREGYAAVHRLATADAVERAIVVRVRLDEAPVSAPPPPTS
jgi:predicted kinase